MAGAADVAAVAALRTSWTGDSPAEAAFVAEFGAWLAAEGDRRTTWLAEVDGEPVGMASLVEFRRMPRPERPDSRWGYLSNMFVRDRVRNRGIGAALLDAVIAAADARGYARLVLSPADRAVSLYLRAGFIVPDAAAGADRLLVRPAPPSRPPGRGAAACPG